MHRSPLAEGMLRQALARDGRTDVTVSSAGVMGFVGARAVAGAAELAMSDGIDLSDHRSRGIAAEDLAADLLLAMEPRHIEEMISRDPDVRSRCRLLSEYADGTRIRSGDIIPDADPSSPGELRRSYEIIKDCVGRFYRSLPPPAQEVYATAVEQRFRTHRRSGIGLSPADYALVEEWWNREIPLWLVLDGIDGALKRRESAVEERARTLRFCRPEVERRFRSYLRTHVPSDTPEGSHGDPPGQTAHEASRLLEECGARAREAGREREAALFESAARSVRSLTAEGPAAVQLELLAIERRLLDSFIDLTPKEELESIRREAVQALDGHRDRMSEEAFGKTVDRMVERSIRDFHAIPTLIDG